MNTVVQIFLALILGGGLWEGFKFFFPEVKRYILKQVSAKKSLYENLDPILKTSSELYGKIESLAKEDFSTFVNPLNSNSKNPEHNQIYIYYLFAQFWAQLEFLRLESKYTSLSRIRKGNHLLKFIDSIESRKYRLLDRSVQRIIGECLLKSPGHRFKVMSLKEFLDEYNNSNSSLRHWINELETILLGAKDKEQRQRVLRFGVIVAILIDYFDSKHHTVRRREIFVNKLSEKSKRMIRNHLLPQYLAFIKKGEQYYIKSESADHFRR